MNTGHGAAVTSHGRTRGVKSREDVNLMKDLMTRAKNKESILFQQKKAKRLEFSNTSLCIYDKHKVLINDIFLNPNINTFVSFNDKQLHSWNPENLKIVNQVTFNDSEQPKSKQVSAIQVICYSKKYHIYFACTKDFNFVVFNEHLNIVHQQRMPVGLVSQISFLEDQKKLFVSGKEGGFIIDLDIEFKYGHRMAVMLDPKGTSISVKIKNIHDFIVSHLSSSPQKQLREPNAQYALNDLVDEEKQEIQKVQNERLEKILEQNKQDKVPVPKDFEKYGDHIMQLQGVGEWVKGLRMFEDQGLFVVWKKEIHSSSNDKQAEANELKKKNSKIKVIDDQVLFYSLRKDKQYEQGEIWSRYFDTQIQEDFITDVLIFKDHKFFVTAHNLGEIHLRKLQELKTLESELAEQRKQLIKKKCTTKGFDEQFNLEDSTEPMDKLLASTQKVIIPSDDQACRFRCDCNKVGKGSSPVKSYRGRSPRKDHEENPKEVVKSKGIKSIHTFKGHSRRVTSLMPIKSKETYFVSASLDGKLKIWCIEKMLELYSFDISLESPLQNSTVEDSIQNSILISDSIYALVYRRAIEIGQISHLATSFFISKQAIQSLNKCFASTHDGRINRPSSLTIQFSDNSVILLNPETKITKCIIYPPPTPSEVVKIFDCSSIQRMFLLLKTNSICIYNTEGETGILEKIHESNHFKDYEQKPLAQNITFIGTCCTEPPKYDCEIFSDMHQYQEPLEPDYKFIGEEDKDGLPLDKFLIIGLSKGTVCFVRLDNLESIYARFSIHRQAIIYIHELKQDNKFISICDEFEMSIFGFHNGREHVYQSFNIQREIFKIITAKKNLLLFCFKSGDSELLYWNNNANQLMRLKNERTDEHDVHITCADAMVQKGLLITGDRQGLVKVWNCKKELIREIKFVEAISSVNFVNPQADIIIGHSGNLSLVKAKDYLDDSMVIYEDEDEIKEETQKEEERMLAEVELMKATNEHKLNYQEKIQSFQEDARAMIQEHQEQRKKNLQAFKEYLKRAEEVTDKWFKELDDGKRDARSKEGQRALWKTVGSSASKDANANAIDVEQALQSLFQQVADEPKKQEVQQEMTSLRRASNIEENPRKQMIKQLLDEFYALNYKQDKQPTQNNQSPSKKKSFNSGQIKLQQMNSSTNHPAIMSSNVSSHGYKTSKEFSKMTHSINQNMAINSPDIAPISIGDQQQQQSTHHSPQEKSQTPKVVAPQRDLQTHIKEARQECIKVPSIPLQCNNIRDKMVQKKKQQKMMSGNTRRMMTNFRISENIIKYNNPQGQVNTFGDMLICSAVDKAQVENDDVQASALPRARQQYKNVQENPSFFQMASQDQKRYSSQMPSHMVDSTANFDNRTFNSYQIQKSALPHNNQTVLGQNAPKGYTQSSEDKRSYNNKTILEQHEEFNNENQKLEEQSNQTVNNQYQDQEKADAGNSPLKPSMLDSAMNDTFDQAQQQQILQSGSLTNQTFLKKGVSQKQMFKNSSKKEMGVKLHSSQDAQRTNMQAQNNINQFYQQNSQDLKPRITLTSDPQEEPVIDQNMKIQASVKPIQDHLGTVEVNASKDQSTSNQISPKMVMLNHYGSSNPMKQFSQQIRGSNRLQNSKEFLNTRMQQKLSKMKNVAPHIVTNIDLKSAKAQEVVFADQIDLSKVQEAQSGERLQDDKSKVRKFSPDDLPGNAKIISDVDDKGIVRLRIKSSQQQTRSQQRSNMMSKTQKAFRKSTATRTNAANRNNLLHHKFYKSGTVKTAPYVYDELGLVQDTNQILDQIQDKKSKVQSMFSKDNKDYETAFSANPTQELFYGEISYNKDKIEPLGSNVYKPMMVKNSLTVGKHMPSKGMYNVQSGSKKQQSKHHKYNKPQTAGAAGKRQRNMQITQDHYKQDYKHPHSGNVNYSGNVNLNFSKCQSQVLQSSMFNSTGKRMMSAFQLSRKVSTYQQNMQHIRYISNIRSAKNRVRSSYMENTAQPSNEDNNHAADAMQQQAYEAPNTIFNPMNDVEIVEITSSQYMNDVRKSMQQIGLSQEQTSQQVQYGKHLLTRSKQIGAEASTSGMANETINSNIQVKAVTAVQGSMQQNTQ